MGQTVRPKGNGEWGMGQTVRPKGNGEWGMGQTVPFRPSGLAQTARGKRPKGNGEEKTTGDLVVLVDFGAAKYMLRKQHWEKQER